LRDSLLSILAYSVFDCVVFLKMYIVEPAFHDSAYTSQPDGLIMQFVNSLLQTMTWEQENGRMSLHTYSTTIPMWYLFKICWYYFQYQLLRFRRISNMVSVIPAFVSPPVNTGYFQCWSILAQFHTNIIMVRIQPFLLSTEIVDNILYL